MTKIFVDQNRGLKTVDGKGVVRSTAIAVAKMATKLDDKPRLSSPTHSTVLGAYLHDSLTGQEIVAKCGRSGPPMQR